MQSTMPKDKVVLDTSDKDSKDVAELLSRMEPGDVVKITSGALSLDENSDGLAVFSIVDIELAGEIETKKKKTKEEQDEEQPQSAALSVLGADNESDIPPESSPSGETQRQNPSQPYAPDELVR